MAGVISTGFTGRRDADNAPLPPGQHRTHDFPVLSAGPTQHVPPQAWRLVITTEDGAEHEWDLATVQGAGVEDIEVDLHCVTGWSKLGTRWRGVPVEALIDQVETDATQVLVHSYGGYTTNLPLEDLLEGRAWIAFEYDGEPLRAEHGGPVRLLVPHLYLWKSAKWLHRLTLERESTPGFWEALGYHSYGDPWREQRYSRS